jgi:hypothetical protein
VGESPIETLDDDEDFVAKKQKGNPNEEEKKCSEHARIKADKKINKKYPTGKVILLKTILTSCHRYC